MSNLALQPATRRQLHDRLLALSPRAFELFAGDLLVFIGLKNVAVTRYVGDGGIDASGELVLESGLVRVPSGVQVKRHRRNVQRADIDRFIGALSGQYQHGIFITTAGYSEQARVKAGTSALRVDTVDGAQVIGLMRRHRLGLPAGDEPYFLGFEAQADGRQLREGSAEYRTAGEAATGTPVPPEEDLISLRALSYALRADPYTVRSWVERGKLAPDRHVQESGRDIYFFRRDRLEVLRQLAGRSPAPGSGAEWREAFLAFIGGRTMSRSYKPVMLQAILRLVNREGEVALDALAAEFRAYYVQRRLAGLPVEFNVPLLAEPVEVPLEQIRRLIITNPLERFIIQGFLHYDTDAGLVRFAPELWSELRYADVLAVLVAADEQLAYYYGRQR
jgi:Restriction endonuclease